MTINKEICINILFCCWFLYIYFIYIGLHRKITQMIKNKHLTANERKIVIKLNFKKEKYRKITNLKN